MKLIVQCPGCKATAWLRPEVADRRIRCLQCGCLFKVPKMEELSRATSTLKRTKGPVFVDEAGRTYG